MEPATEDSDETPGRRRLRVLLMFGIALLFVGTLGDPILDAWDKEHPKRDLVARDAAPGSRPVPIDIGSGGEPCEDVEDALRALPEAYRDLAEAQLARVEIVDTESLSKRADGKQELTVVAGLYLPEDHRMLVAHDAARPGLTALHEFGHFVDHVLGQPSASPDFKEIFEMAPKRDAVPPLYQDEAAQLFAELFARYHFSDRQRARLEDRFPEAHAFFGALLQRVNGDATPPP